jgi:hypothetical protein
MLLKDSRDCSPPLRHCVHTVQHLKLVYRHSYGLPVDLCNDYLTLSDNAYNIPACEFYKVVRHMKPG